MAPEKFFCSLASRGNGESIYGTVALIRSWLLLEYPSSWRRHAVEDSRRLSKAVKERIGGLVDRTLLIRREHTRSGPIHCFFADSCATPPRLTCALFSEYDDLLGPSLQTEPVDRTMYAVCTHGRHDKCCAKFGLPVFCALRDQVGERAWECSHVGGDRFAANVVVFPYGLYYGRVDPEEAGEVVRRSEAGELWLERYRGRSCYPRAVQVAEYFLRTETRRTRIDDFRPIDTAHDSHGATLVRFQDQTSAAIHVVEFARTAPLHELLTCRATEPSPVAQYRLIRHSIA